MQGINNEETIAMLEMVLVFGVFVGVHEGATCVNVCVCVAV